MGYVIERLDGTTDGLGDAVVFTTEAAAWQAAEEAFGADRASDGAAGVRAWLRVRALDDEEVLARAVGATAAGWYNAGARDVSEAGLAELPAAEDVGALERELGRKLTRDERAAFTRAVRTHLRQLVEGA
jgi:hypothetical protein